jgi:hypothetical protein
MKLKDFLAISGEGTLFKFIAQGKNAIIVENLETGRRMTAGGTTKVSALDEISIYTSGEDMPLAKVMDRIWDKENGGEAISYKSADADMKKYFDEVLPEYDHDRVYTSDIKKVLHWYNILHKLGLLVKEEPEEEKAEEKTEEEVKEKPAKKAPEKSGEAKPKKPAKKSTGK